TRTRARRGDSRAPRAATPPRAAAPCCRRAARTPALSPASRERLLDDRPHVGGDGVGRARGIDSPHALRLRPAEFEVAAADATMEAETELLEPVQTTPADPPKSFRRREIEQQRQVGQDTTGRAKVEIADHFEIDPAPVSLVRDRRVGIAIAEHDTSLLEPRGDLLDDVLAPRRHEEPQLGEPVRGLFEEPPDLDAEPGAVRFSRALDGMTGTPEAAGEPFHLG